MSQYDPYTIRAFRRSAETNPRYPIFVSPHYSDPTYREPQTTYLADGVKEEGSGFPVVAGLSYDYDDRLRQWDYRKFEASARAADDGGAMKASADWFSAFISRYHGRDLEVVHVIAGVNVSNGYPYYVLGHREKVR